MSTLTVSTITAIGAGPLLFQVNGSTMLSATTSGIGVNTSTPVGMFEVAGSDPSVYVSRYTAATGGANLYLRHSRGATQGTNTSLTSGDRIGVVVFSGANGTSYLDAAQVRGEVDGTPSATSMPGRLSLWTTPDGTTTPMERIRVDSPGNIGVNGAPGSWHSNARAIQMGGAGGLWNYSTSQMNLSQGLRYDASGYKYLQSGLRSGNLSMNDGALYYQQAASGTQGAAATMHDAFQVTQGGNMGVNVAPAPWGDPYRAMEVNAAGRGIAASAGTTYVTGNAYYDGADWRRHETGVGLLYAQDVQHSWYVSSSGPAGGNIVWTQAAILTNSGDLLLTGGGLLGYGVGNGGTVAQTTSRTTPVTLDKTCGSITLFSTTATAGDTVVFQFNNAKISASDTVVVNVKTSAGVYLANVIGVSAGSCQIAITTPFAIGSPEAPVLNFAVINGVTS